MNKIIISIIIINLSCINLSGQKFDIRVQAGANLTWVPDFENIVLIANDGIIIQGLIAPMNSYSTLLVSSSTSKTSPGFGLDADVEIRYNLGRSWKISVACGLDIMKYDFDTFIEVPGTPNIWLSEYTTGYGNTSIYFLNIRPLNISKAILHNKLAIQAGISLDILLKSDNYNVLIVYAADPENSGKADGIERIYFNSFGAVNNFIFGLQGRVEYNVFNNFNAFVCYQHFFSSVYDKKSSSSQTVKDAKASQVQVGLSYVFWNF